MTSGFQKWHTVEEDEEEEEKTKNKTWAAQKNIHFLFEPPPAALPGAMMKLMPSPLTSTLT